MVYILIKVIKINKLNKKLKNDIMHLAVKVRNEMKLKGFSKKEIDFYFNSGQFVENLKPVLIK